MPPIFDTSNSTTTTNPNPNILDIALKENEHKLQDARYTIMDEQENLNNIINRLNNLKFAINTLKNRNKYTVAGDLTFY
jgi:hypothetical protein